MRRYPIVREVSNLFIGPILIFALYVQFHGDFGPGGGFQAGVILAAGFILYALVYGLEQLQRTVTPFLVQAMTAGGVLLFAGTGIVSLIKGGTYLDYNVLAHDAYHGQHPQNLLRCPPSLLWYLWRACWDRSDH